MNNILIKKLIPLAVAFTIGGLSPALAQVNEDEWYDPTDWFDGNNIESDDTYDYDAYDYGYDYDYGVGNTYTYGDNWDAYGTWGYDTWEPGYYNAGYWDKFDWDDEIDEIDTDWDRSYTYIAFADPASNQQNSKPQASKTGTKQGMKESRQVARLNGKVEGFSKVQLKRESGAMAAYIVANVKLDNGKSTIVNLGRESQLKDLDLEKGDSFKALGRRGMIGGETVFVAHKLTVDGRTVDANPAIRLAGSNKTDSSQQTKDKTSSMRTLKGTVASVEETKPQGSRADHTFINLKLENGQAALVDLGPAASVDKIDLDEGDTITVRGSTKQVGNRQVLVPQLLKIEGERITSVSK